MADYKPSSDFHNAAAYLSSASSLAQVSTPIKLELYGLFKYLTSSRTPTTSRPSIFDMTGRAKWDTWTATGKKYGRSEDAEQRYLEIARSLGWTELAKVEVKVKPEPTSADADEDIWDKDDTPRSAGGGGLGTSVSSMAPPPIVIDKSIHGLALSNDISGLTTLLENAPETDLNALDEFGYAPMHLACDRGNAEIVKFLLARGADRNIKDPDGLSPLELSQEAGHSEIETLLASAS